MNYLDNIHTIKKEHKLSKKKVAEYLGISQRFYSDLENGDRQRIKYFYGYHFAFLSHTAMYPLNFP